MHLKEVSIKSLPPDLAAQYPFCIPVIQSLGSVKLDRPVTILVGENGCGKSTLLEALAVAAESIAVGGQSLEKDLTLDHVRALADYLRLGWVKKTRKGFFLRSEDFFNFARRVREEQIELKAMADEYDRTLTGYGRQLAVGAMMGQQRALEAQYGKDLDAHSHGESFLKLFGSRLSPGGLYILDEPEAPLSPLRQIALIAMIQDCVKSGSQFVIATHAPILMAYPDAQILGIENGRISPVAFDDLEHVKITRSFLNNPESFLRHL